MKRVTISKTISGFLKELGDTSDEVARSLEERRISGVKGWGGSCPIYNYLKSRGCNVYFVEEGMIIDGSYGYTFTTAPVKEFIRRFDKGEFPELELKDG